MENVPENQSSDLKFESQTCSEAPKSFLSLQSAISSSKDHNPPSLERTGSDDRVTIGCKQEDEAAQSNPPKVANLDEIVTEEIDVDRRHQVFFFSKRASLIKKITRENGGVQIIFPPHRSDSSKVTLKGAKRYVDTTKLAISEVVADLECGAFTHCKEEMDVDRRHQTFFFYDQACLIQKISRENGGVQITFPPAGSDSNTVVLRGAKKYVNTAKLAISEVVADLECGAFTYCKEEIDVDRRHQTFFFHDQACLIQKISRENGGVQITFPPAGSDSSTVVLRGAKKYVNTAKLAISEVVADLERHADTRCEEEIHVDRRHHKSFFDNRAYLIQKISRENGVRIIFPPLRSNSNKVLLQGAAEDVNKAKLAISEVVAGLERHVVSECDETVREEIDVDRRDQRFFFRDRASLIQKISRENGGVRISFPPAGSDSNKVVLEGGKKYVNAAKLAIFEVAADLERHVAIKCTIPRKYCGKVLGTGGINARTLGQEHNVYIEFPKRATRRVGGVETATGSGVDNKASVSEDTADPLNDDIEVSIRGKEDDCLKVKKALLDLVPRQIVVDVPFYLHRAIFGQHYENVLTMGRRYGVWIEIPHPWLQKDCVYVRGTSDNCEEAEEALLNCVEQLQKETHVCVFYPRWQ